MKGKKAFAERLDPLKDAFPDMRIHDEYVLADGNRAAVEYIMEGTQSGPFSLPDGTVLPPSGKKVKVRGIEFLEFDKTALLKEVVVVQNQHDFVAQLQE
jgi:predicted ester cyclase